nr:MAG TPA: integrase [Caudoviricetes sp.]
MKIHIIKPDAISVKKLRVCAYCRVSTEAEDQENSLENQKVHYEELIKNNPEYEFVKIYYDFGVSGYKESRPAFQEMLQDARNGKIDLIITKSVSRFARNTVTFLKAVRELKEIGVGIFFELQNSNTLTETGEMMLTIISAFAQAESETYSQLSKMGIQRKYEKGEPIQRLERCFGYMKNEEGEYVLDPEEAKWVKLIYEFIADGYTTADVKRYLNSNGVKTVKGARFTESTIFRIVENEIYKGDFIMHKHFVNSERKEVRNTGQVDSWYIEDDHPAIVSKRLWQKAQDAIVAKRDYLATGSIVGENSEEVYPHKNKVFCDKCGYPLYLRVYSNGNRANWGCSGQKRYNKRFCKGINVPDSVIRSWGELNEPVYVRKVTDKFGKSTFKYSKETAWSRKHKKKEVPIIPELNEKNYPYFKKIYCKECGSRLVRLTQANEAVKWICNGNKRKGAAFCRGIRVPDEVIRAWNIDEEILVERKGAKHGKESYSYTSKTGTGKKQ